MGSREPESRPARRGAKPLEPCPAGPNEVSSLRLWLGDGGKRAGTDDRCSGDNLAAAASVRAWPRAIGTSALRKELSSASSWWRRLCLRVSACRRETALWPDVDHSSAPLFAARGSRWRSLHGIVVRDCQGQPGHALPSGCCRSRRTEVGRRSSRSWCCCAADLPVGCSRPSRQEPTTGHAQLRVGLCALLLCYHQLLRPIPTRTVLNGGSPESDQPTNGAERTRGASR